MDFYLNSYIITDKNILDKEHQWTALSREITWNKFKSKEQDSIKFYILEC